MIDIEEMLEIIQDMTREALSPVRGRLMDLVSRAVISLVDDTLKMQGVQVIIGGGDDTSTDDEVLPDVERFQNYGFTAKPFSGAEGIVINVGSNPDHPVVIAVDDRRFRLKSLTEGEVAMYDDQGQVVKIGRNAIEVTAASGNDIIGTVAGGGTIQWGGTTPIAVDGDNIAGMTGPGGVPAHTHTIGISTPPVPLTDGTGEVEASTTNAQAG